MINIEKTVLIDAKRLSKSFKNQLVIDDLSASFNGGGI